MAILRIQGLGPDCCSRSCWRFRLSSDIPIIFYTTTFSAEGSTSKVWG